ncbi:MAG: hypothetical protein AB8B71_14760, partial [Paracoccaceae bacterium]
ARVLSVKARLHARPIWTLFRLCCNKALMADKPTSPNLESREERLKAALKANMAKRKAQARARNAPAEQGLTKAQTGKDEQDG